MHDYETRIIEVPSRFFHTTYDGAKIRSLMQIIHCHRAPEASCKKLVLRFALKDGRCLDFALSVPIELSAEFEAAILLWQAGFD